LKSSRFRIIEIPENMISSFDLPKRNFVKKLKILRYDVAIDMSFTFDIFTAWLCNEINASVKIGFSRRGTSGSGYGFDVSDVFYNFQLAVKPNTDLRKAYSGMINCLSLF
jgi:hypothetical protein